jgi:arabinonate dehydratase
MTETPSPLLRLHPKDNILVAVQDMEPGAQTGVMSVLCREKIPAGHKVAVEEIRPGEPLRKYGQVIGFALEPISPGDWVHTHNLGMGDPARDYAFAEEAASTPLKPEQERPLFSGIVRPDGRVGTRNYIGILPTVNCSAGVGRFIAWTFQADELEAFPNVDGIFALGHGSGCCLTPDGDGFLFLQRVLAGYAAHPNFGGLVLLGLGCELNHVGCLVENMGIRAGESLRILEIQNAGGTKETVRQGVAAVRDMLPAVNRVAREPAPVSHLTIGLECGGSDAYSGITANPAVGAAADLLVRNGGTAVLSETPEIYGAEHLLTRRAMDREVGEKLVRRIHWWEDYTHSHGGEINNNPTPGNKAGGLTTILEKSLGAVSKAGTTGLTAVYEYAESVTEKGLVFMDTPGYDIASVTGMIAGGANLICFTTGRGTVCGFKPVPTVKIASNTRMYSRFEEDMDVNAGRILDGEMTVEEMGRLIFERLVRTASGARTKSEILGFGEDEFVPWHVGPVM